MFSLCAEMKSASCLAQSSPPAADASAKPEEKPQDKAVAKVKPNPLQKYTGRYELETGLIPISTLDITLQDNQLWIKPSLSKKRKLIHTVRNQYADEVGGTTYTFYKDEEGKVISVAFEYEGATYTAQKITLPPPSLTGNTTFRLKGYPDANIVAVAGSFNGWNQSQLIFGRQGDEWVCRVDLEPGKYTYKFIVDGDWLLDPNNPNVEDDDYGTKNSVLIVNK